MKFATFAFALWMAQSALAEHIFESYGDFVFTTAIDRPDGTRALAGAGAGQITAECFNECVKQQMTAAQCQRYIEQVLGGDLKDHVIPDLKIVVSEPRPPSVKANTYFMVGIPTNVKGEVKCDLNDATISYRDKWETPSGKYDIPEVKCTGLTAKACCDKFQASLKANNIPKYDVNGNCLACWAHQETLQPQIGQSGSVVYLLPEAKAEGKCVVAEAPPSEIQAIDSGVKAACVNLGQRIDNIIGTGGTCTELTALQRDLLLWARSFPPAMAQISKFLCGYCDGVSTYHPLPDTMVQALQYIKTEISKEVKSDTNKIVIYTDHQGYVMESPSLGGDRAQLDSNRDDPDCDLAGDLAPPPKFFSNGTVIPEDTGICDALAMSEQSMVGAPCSTCRKCLLKECHWDNGSFCKNLMEGKADGTADQWLACLNSQGISDVLKPGAVDNGFDNWCHCALKCEESCLKEPLGDKKDMRIRECTAEDMSKRSEENEQCHNCRTCLESECPKTWSPKHWCSFLIAGKRNGTPDQWLACLETEGKSNVLGRTMAEDDLGKRDTWKGCGRKCDPACYKKRVEPLSAGNICMYKELANHSALGDFCQGCRSCMMRTCTYWSGKCDAMLKGTVVGTPDNWNWCLNNCGRGLTRNLRQLTTDDGLGTPRSTWCTCSRECDERCYYPEDIKITR